MTTLADQATHHLREAERLTAAVGRLPAWQAILSPTLILSWFLSCQALRALNFSIGPDDFPDVAAADAYGRRAVAVSRRVARLVEELHEVAESGARN